jgi:hypothetical protein
MLEYLFHQAISVYEMTNIFRDLQAGSSSLQSKPTPSRKMMFVLFLFLFVFSNQS